ncbi:hypothetical protein BDW68DRAFT_19685 [Aspergillus falconensis]
MFLKSYRSQATGVRYQASSSTVPITLSPSMPRRLAASFRMLFESVFGKSLALLFCVVVCAHSSIGSAREGGWVERRTFSS